jgi:TonB family protein
VEVKTAAVSSAAKSSASTKVETAALIPKPELPKLEVPTIEKPALDIPAPVTQIEKPVSAATSSAAPAKPAAITAAKVEEEEEEGPALTAQSLLARQFYVSDAIKKIRGKTRYPQRALDRDQEGSVRVAIVIDREGTVLSTNVLDASKFDLLNKEALDAIKRSAPFPALPADIPGARFEFTVPMRWTLPK